MLESACHQNAVYREFSIIITVMGGVGCSITECPLMWVKLLAFRKITPCYLNADLKRKRKSTYIRVPNCSLPKANCRIFIANLTFYWHWYTSWCTIWGAMVISKHGKFCFWSLDTKNTNWVSGYHHRQLQIPQRIFAVLRVVLRSARQWLARIKYIWAAYAHQTAMTKFW